MHSPTNHQKKISRRLGVIAVNAALMMLATAAHSEEISKMFSISGFGTVAATHSSSEKAEYVTSRFQRHGAGGISNNWSMGVDSNLGVQLDGKFTDQLSGVVQVISTTRPNNTFSPRVEWANLQYAFTPDIKVRVGRVALPTFMVSDTRMVGYANPWIRPPMETYSLNNITSSDGIDASYRRSFGPLTNTVQAYYGNTKTNIYTTALAINGLKAKNIHGIVDTVEYGAFTARAGVNLLHTEVPFNGTISHGSFRALNLGAAYDPGHWFLQGEFSKSNLGSKAFYTTAGYRLNKFTPYVSYSKSTPDGVGQTSRIDQKSAALGIRWDLMKNVDLKLQWDRVTLGTGNGYFANPTGVIAGSKTNVVGVAVDFIF